MVVLLLALGASPSVAAPPGHVELYAPIEIIDLGDGQIRAFNEAGQLTLWARQPGGPVETYFWDPADGLTRIPVPSGFYFLPGDLNNDGLVVGTLFESVESGSAPAFWSSSTGFVQLPQPLLGATSGAVAVSDAGEVFIGAHVPPTPGNHQATVWRWTADDGYFNIGNLGGCCVTSVGASNDVGQLSGQTDSPTGHGGFFWDENTGMIPIGSLAPGSVGSVMPRAMNSIGAVVGLSPSGDPSLPHPFYWSTTTGLIDMGVPEGGRQATPMAVNDASEAVVFFVFDRGPQFRSYIWSPGGELADIGSIVQNGSTVATDINSHGAVVGGAQVNTSGPTKQSHAFVWTEARGFVDLDTLGGPSSSAQWINDAGQIAGTAQRLDGGHSAVVWVPVEPIAPIQQLIDAFDDGVQDGSLAPLSAGQGGVVAFRNVLERAAEWEESGDLASACGFLDDARARSDGESSPADWIAGSGLDAFFDEIGSTQTELGCAPP